MQNSMTEHFAQVLPRPLSRGLNNVINNLALAADFQRRLKSPAQQFHHSFYLIFLSDYKLSKKYF